MLTPEALDNLFGQSVTYGRAYFFNMSSIIKDTEPSERAKTMDFFAKHLLVKMRKVAPDATLEDALALIKRVVEFYAVATPIPDKKRKT